MEILNLTWDRIHIENVIDLSIEIIEAKNNKSRFVPLNDEMINLLTDLKTKNTDNKFVFLSSFGKHLHTIRKPFKSALNRTGILNFRFHDLRHTFASHFIMYDGDPLTLKEILGHSSMTMVQRYAHLASAHKRKQVNNLGKIFK